MTHHHINSEGDDRPRHGDPACGIAPDHEALLDHHVEELLGALGDLAALAREFDEYGS